MASAAAAGLVCVGVRTAVTQGHDLGEVMLLVNSLEELDLSTLRSVRDFARKEWPFGPFG